jgi:hypothetical protein
LDSDNVFKLDKNKCYGDNSLSFNWLKNWKEITIEGFVWKEIPIDELAKRSGMKVYDVVKEFEICKDGVVPLVFKSPKRELTKRKTVFKIVKNLPSTLRVLSKRVGLPKTSVKRYLDKLLAIGVIQQELDMFYLKGIYAKDRRCLIKSVMDAWYSFLPEYQVPSVSNPNPVDSAVKLLIRGHPIDEINRINAEHKKVKKFLRKRHRDKGQGL